MCTNAANPVQDLSMHKEEIHSKLVAIMRERLGTNLKQLPIVATTWTASAPVPAQGSPPPPSNFAQTNAKQLRILSQVCCSAIRNSSEAASSALAVADGVAVWFVLLVLLHIKLLSCLR